MKFLNNQVKPCESRALCGLALVFLYLAPVISQARETPLPDLETMSRLRLGEIVVESAPGQEKEAAVQASLMIWAPVGEIWAVVY